MKRLLLPLLAALALPTAVNADMPYVFGNSGRWENSKPQIKSLEDCMTRGRKQLLRAGFTQNLEEFSVALSAEHYRRTPTKVYYECNINEKIWYFGVSSPDPNYTLDGVSDMDNVFAK